MQSAFQQGKIARAVELLERAAEINPADYIASGFDSFTWYRSLGRDSETKAAARKTVELAERELILNPEDPRPAIAGALALLELGEKDRAKDWTTASCKPSSRKTRSALYNIACVYSHLGECDAAFDLLASGYSQQRATVLERLDRERLRSGWPAKSSALPTTRLSAKRTVSRERKIRAPV